MSDRPTYLPTDRPTDGPTRPRISGQPAPSPRPAPPCMLRSHQAKGQAGEQKRRPRFGLAVDLGPDCRPRAPIHYPELIDRDVSNWQSGAVMQAMRRRRTRVPVSSRASRLPSRPGICARYTATIRHQQPCKTPTRATVMHGCTRGSM